MSLALLTDLYQLTMASGYWQTGMAEREAVFHLFFRSPPFGGGYAVACGLEPATDYLRQLRFSGDDLAYLATLTGNDGAPLFSAGFIDWLDKMVWSADVDAIPEGTAVFAHEPLLRVRGPLAQCQIVESALLNLINYQTLIATKAARVCEAARGEPVLEFGLRRAQGIDGALAASRAAYVGGCVASSNVLAGKRYGIPVRGTHAHSWVMSFDTELAAFAAYADAMPNNALFLVDTYDTLDGVRHAIEIGRRLRDRGSELVGVRLDSGDLAHLSAEARRMLDAAGFPDAVIVASNDLDEHIIESLHQQGAAVSVWGVGTKLVTGHHQPALGGVYKLSAIRGADGAWQHKVKLSEQAVKISIPGIQQVRRYYAGDALLADVIFDTAHPPAAAGQVCDIADPTLCRELPAHTRAEDLLVPVFRGGKLVREAPPLADVRDRTRAQLAGLSARTRRLLNPQPYPVGLEPTLHELKWNLVARARGETRGGTS